MGKEIPHCSALVDAFGDVVMCTSLCYDTWRTRHNDVQRALVAKAHEARVEVDAEVLGLFRDTIPDQALEAGGQLETPRQRNGCICKDKAKATKNPRSGQRFNQNVGLF